MRSPAGSCSSAVSTFVEMHPNRMNNYCCGAGGGAWAMPYSDERIYYGRVKAQQIRDTGAKTGGCALPQLPGPDHEGPHQGV